VLLLCDIREFQGSQSVSIKQKKKEKLSCSVANKRRPRPHRAQAPTKPSPQFYFIFEKYSLICREFIRICRTCVTEKAKRFGHGLLSLSWRPTRIYTSECSKIFHAFKTHIINRVLKILLGCGKRYTERVPGILRTYIPYISWDFGCLPYSV
jgi:hypothetical protein